MTYQIVSHTALHPDRDAVVIGCYPTYLDAKRAAYKQFQIAHYEKDAHVAYEAADFLTEQGAIYSIDPVKGKPVTDGEW